jgi:hypothetical protein
MVKGEVRDFTPNGVLELWSNEFRRIIFGRPLVLPNFPTLQHSIPSQTLATDGIIILPQPLVE